MSLVAALAAIVLGTVLGPTQRPAAAHTGGPGAITLRQCSTADKYGCASHNMTRYNSVYGPYYEVYHAHVCTDKSTNSTSYSVKEMAIYFTLSPYQVE